jgi:lipopolysaccharide export system protein LptC
MDDMQDTALDGRDNLTRLLNLGRRKRPRISRRYSVVVQGLRYLLPVTALAIVTIVVSWPKMDEAIKPIPKQNIIPQNTGRNELINPHFESTTQDKQPYVITAASAVQSMGDTSVILLEQPVAAVTMKNGAKVTAKASSGVYRQDVRILALEGKVVMNHNSGYTLYSDRLNISVDDQVSWTDTAVHGDGPAGTLDARAMNANNKTGMIILTGPAKLVLTQSDRKTKL